MKWMADLWPLPWDTPSQPRENLNVRITGTFGVLMKAKRDGEIPIAEIRDGSASSRMPGSSSWTVSEMRFSLRRERAHKTNYLKLAA